MRRATSLRTGPSIYALYGIIWDAVSDGIWNRFFADAQNDNERTLRMTVGSSSE